MTIEATLRARNDILEEQVAQLRSLLVPAFEFPVGWGLSRAETNILRSLLGAPDGRRSSAALHAAVSGMEPESDPKIVQVYVCKIRKKLKAIGVLIITIHGFGYRLDPAARTLIKAALAWRA